MKRESLDWGIENQRENWESQRERGEREKINCVWNERKKVREL